MDALDVLRLILEFLVVIGGTGGIASWVLSKKQARKTDAEADKAGVESDKLRAEFVTSSSMQMYDRIATELNGVKKEIRTLKRVVFLLDRHVDKQDDVIRSLGGIPLPYPDIYNIEDFKDESN